MLFRRHETISLPPGNGPYTLDFILRIDINIFCALSHLKASSHLNTADMFLQSTISDLRRSINVHVLLRYSLPLAKITPEAELARATQYLTQYLEGLKLGTSLPSTELQHADDLAILTAQVFVNLWKMTEAESYLYNAASILEFGLTRSKNSFQMRLLLVRIYTLLGW